MRSAFSPYFDKQYLLSPGGENGILFTAEYATMAKETNDKLFIAQATAALWSQIQNLNELELKRFPGNTRYSHDNMTGLVCLSKLTGTSIHKSYFWTDWWYRCHPRDVVFYLHAKGGIWEALMLPFLWILSLCMIVSVGWSTYKQIDGKQVLATDGMLLTWLRLNSFKFPLTEVICNYIVKKKYGNWQPIFSIYFKDPAHPLNVLTKELNI